MPRLRRLAFAAALALTLAVPAAATAAGPPVVTSTSFSGVGESSATLAGSVDPDGVRTTARFAYLTQAEFESSGFAHAGLTPPLTLQPTVKGTGDLTAGSKVVTDVEATGGAFAVGQEIKATPAVIPAGTTITATAADELTLSAAATASATGAQLTASGPQTVAAQVTGLAPQTLYRFHLLAENTKAESATGPDRGFATLAPPPAFGPCPNDAFRTGILSPPGDPSSFLPDCRAYERATPADKDGGDVQGELPQLKAAAAGGAVTFMSSFGVPGGQGAQSLPTYLASRGEGDWSSRGLLPPASAGQKAAVVGWSPDMDRIYTEAVRLGEPRTSALFVQGAGGPPTEITPYAPQGPEYLYSYVGSSADGSVVVFEWPGALPAEEGGPPLPGAREGARNLYAWDRGTGRLSLAGVMNDGTSPPKGTLGGPYEWSQGINSQSLRLGGSYRGYYTQDERAVSGEGAVFFTAVGSGQLYQRLNPTAPQSAMNGEECTEPAKACTVHVSATHKTNGEGPGGTDGAGPQPAAFMAASADGRQAFFTSPEKLTNDANTGPEQPPARIERDDLAGGAVETPDFVPGHAVGVAVDSGHVYWADPATGTIGRAGIDGTDPEPGFIEPGPTEFETHPFAAPGVLEEVPSSPRYVAVGPCAGGGECLYWTNTGAEGREYKLGFFEAGPVAGSGTIGRARIDAAGCAPDPAPCQVEPEFITGASNPQGIAVNPEHVYWANAGEGVRGIGRATIEGGEVRQGFFSDANFVPYGVALSPEYVYFGSNEEANDDGFVRRIPLEGGKEELFFVGKAGVRGVAVDGSHVYWATQGEGEEAIGRNGLAPANFAVGGCKNIPGCEKEFIPLTGGPDGLAVDAGHLYWASNGEAPANPGADLYRYGPGAGRLEDLTPDPDGDGAEVRGVLGASADGAYVYFAANAVLASNTVEDGAGPKQATPGDCEGTIGSSEGSCNLYLWHEGAIEFVAPLKTDRGEESDVLDWAGTPKGQFGSGPYVPRTSFLGDGGRVLLFRSQERLTAYENERVPELYRFRVGQGTSCVSCLPSGEAPGDGPHLGRLIFPGLGPSVHVASVSSHILSADGERVFFETSEALVAEDTNGAEGCPLAGTGAQDYPSCDDVYEWEAPGSGTCTAGGPGWSPLDRGCIYLISTGHSDEPSLLVDASASGDDVYLLTRDGLVGSDTDGLTDVYDARVEGGLASQNPVPANPCEGEACKAGATPPPSVATPPEFSGPGNQRSAPPRCTAKKKKGKHKAKGCGRKHRRRHHRKHKHHKRHEHPSRAGR